MQAELPRLNWLAQKLWEKGIAAFCPTTLSAPPKVLAEAVKKLGQWIQTFSVTSSNLESCFGALPLGIHLEGPYLNISSCGAHPPQFIRKFDFNELKHLWKLSQKTLKIISLAPENLHPIQLKALNRWCKNYGISLFIGHSCATQEQALRAFQSGFHGITHAWNALPFHHRNPGPLGAALGRKDVFLELILDQIHVSPTLIRWTEKLHGFDQICFISDCVPAAGTRGKWHPFGSLKVRYQHGVCRSPHGHLAGGGKLVTESYCNWLMQESQFRKKKITDLFQESVKSLTQTPLRLLSSLTPQQVQFLKRSRKIRWEISPSSIRLTPSALPYNCPNPSRPKCILVS